jgi:hypothetical protein
MNPGTGGNRIDPNHLAVGKRRAQFRPAPRKEQNGGQKDERPGDPVPDRLNRRDIFD